MASFYPSLSIALSPSFIWSNFFYIPSRCPLKFSPFLSNYLFSPLYLPFLSVSIFHPLNSSLSFTHSISHSLSPPQFLPQYFSYTVWFYMKHSNCEACSEICGNMMKNETPKIWISHNCSFILCRKEQSCEALEAANVVLKEEEDWKDEEERRRWRPYYFHSLLCVWSTPTSFHPKMISFSLFSSSLSPLLSPSLSPPPSLSPSLPPPPYSLPFLLPLNLSLVLSTSGWIIHNGIQRAGK